MEPLEVLAIAVALGLDAMSVSAAIGVRWHGPRQKFRLAWHMGLFQFLMPILGWQVGRGVDRWVAAFDHWVAFGLLAFVGGKMIWEGLTAEEDVSPADPSRGWRLVALSVATSIDALAVGLSLSLLDVPVVGPALLIGAVTFSLSLLGGLIGSRLGHFCESKIEALGGLILIHGQQPALTATQRARYGKRSGHAPAGFEPGDADPAAMRETLDAARSRLGPAAPTDGPPQSAARQRALLREAVANHSVPLGTGPTVGTPTQLP
jgi:putative Mn2+ efflux pump MntP